MSPDDRYVLIACMKELNEEDDVPPPQVGGKNFIYVVDLTGEEQPYVFPVDHQGTLYRLLLKS